jgi:formylglycine-generating enzyme required for sulfatase activity
MARECQVAWAKHLRVPVEYENSLGMKLRLVPPGEFLMGSLEQEITALLREDDGAMRPRILAEGPQHAVRITQPFYIGIHEVTVGQFRKFVQATGFRTYAETRAKKSKFNWKNVDFEQTDQHPVVYVNWDDAVAFCQWLSTTEGHLYRSPSEAQWEYACRAGSHGRWCFGDDSEELEQFAWLLADGPRQAVGQKRANAFGIYDMHGNAVERCQGWYAADYYGVSPTDDPDGPATGTLRVTRGGFGLASAPARSALRSENHAKTPLSFGGIRVVRILR